jgi:hypothetical protein
MNSFWVLAFLYSPFLLAAGLEIFAAKTKKLNSFGIFFILGFYMVLLIFLEPTEAAAVIVNTRTFKIIWKILSLLLPIIAIVLNIDGVICGIKILREGFNFRTIILVILFLFCIIVWDYIVFRFQIPGLIKEIL